MDSLELTAHVSSLFIGASPWLLPSLRHPQPTGVFWVGRRFLLLPGRFAKQNLRAREDPAGPAWPAPRAEL